MPGRLATEKYDRPGRLASIVRSWLRLPDKVHANDPTAPAIVARTEVKPALAVDTRITRIVADIRASGPVTERAIALATLNTLYALVLASALVPQLERPQAPADARGAARARLNLRTGERWLTRFSPNWFGMN